MLRSSPSRGPRQRVIAKDRVQGYVENTGRVLRGLTLITSSQNAFDEAAVSKVLEWAERYFKDAAYFFERGDYVNALTAIAYCEGILEALKLLGFASFSW